MRGFVEGKNLALDVPSLNTAGLDWMRMDLVKPLKKNPDAIFAFTSRVADAARAEAPAIPLVFVWAADPVTAGIAKDYARPGGQSTGVANRFSDVAGTRLELLREIAPTIRRVAVAGSTYQPEEAAALAALRPVAQGLRIDLMEVSAGPGQITLELQHAFRKGAEAMLPLQIFSALGYRGIGEEIVRICARQRAPAIFAESEMVEAGALMSYGTNLVDEVRRGADMLAKILSGGKPAEIPIDQASEFELAVNLKTAQQMHIQVPAAVLARASRVIV